MNQQSSTTFLQKRKERGLEIPPRKDKTASSQETKTADSHEAAHWAGLTGTDTLLFYRIKEKIKFLLSNFPDYFTITYCNSFFDKLGCNLTEGGRGE